MTTCKWFARCVRPAAGVVAHPILGDVPTCQPCAVMLDLDLRPFPAVMWPNIERDVPVTPALARRFVPRNWSFGYNGHSVYQLGTTPADLYAVTRDKDGALVITGRILGANSTSTADLIAFLSEWEG